MGWREFRHWLRELNRAVAAEQGDGTTDPDSWAGHETDDFWRQQKERHRQIRGR